MANSTKLIHHPYQPPEGFVAPQVPTHQASTVIFPNVQSLRSRDWKDKSGYSYGLHGTPTTFTLEERLATLEGARYCQLVPSGLAAIALVNLSLLKSGDHVLVPSNVYAPSLALLQSEMARLGVDHNVYDPMSLEDLSSAITARTRLVWIEAPGSVTMEFPDLIGILRVCRERKVLSALDNTWGGGVAFNPFGLGGEAVDVSIQALTKYASGGADVLMGSVCTVDETLGLKIRLTHMRLGLGVGAQDVGLVLRALPSLHLRYAAQDRSARVLANALARCPQVAQVLHPCIAQSPGHEHWKTCCKAVESEDLTRENSAHEDFANEDFSREHIKGDQYKASAAGIFSVIFNSVYGQEKIDEFCDNLRLFKLGYSWGGPMSLVVPYDLSLIRAQNSRVAPLAQGCLVRFCVGLEETKDLLQDLLGSVHAVLK